MKVSIITASLNRAEFVERAILSVLDQQVPDLEHLIVDGGSTDASTGIYRRYPHLKVVMEPDRNVYDAFNKGISRATGDVIGILNSDDIYLPGTLKTVLARFEACPDLDLVSGGCILVKDLGNQEQEVSRYLDKSFLRLDAELLLRQPPLVNGRFFKREVFERMGGFDVSFPVVADREFMIRCALADLKNHEMETAFCKYTMHAAALSHKPEGVGLRVLQENMACALHYQRTSSNGSARRIHGMWAAWSALQLAIEPFRRRSYFVAAMRLLHHAPRILRYFASLIRLMYFQRLQQPLHRPVPMQGASG
jgi:glycosyltransferase involved in cell wall biosynthesis